MRFENIEVGDYVLYDTTYTKVIMKDEHRMVIDADKCYLADWGKCKPVDLIWDSTVETLGYRKYGEENGQAVFEKRIQTTSTVLDPVVISTLRRNEKHQWFMSIKVIKGLKNELCFDEVVNIPVKYVVQINRMEEAFRIVASEKL